MPAAYTLNLKKKEALNKAEIRIKIENTKAQLEIDKIEIINNVKKEFLKWKFIVNITSKL
jgi:hypothetical protein